jgi:hypothetical protein
MGCSRLIPVGARTLSPSLRKLSRQTWGRQGRPSGPGMDRLRPRRLFWYCTTLRECSARSPRRPRFGSRRSCSRARRTRAARPRTTCVRHRRRRARRDVAATAWRHVGKLSSAMHAYVGPGLYREEIVVELRDEGEGAEAQVDEALDAEVGLEETPGPRGADSRRREPGREGSAACLLPGPIDVGGGHLDVELGRLAHRELSVEVAREVGVGDRAGCSACRLTLPLHLARMPPSPAGFRGPRGGLCVRCAHGFYGATSDNEEGFFARRAGEQEGRRHAIPRCVKKSP